MTDLISVVPPIFDAEHDPSFSKFETFLMRVLPIFEINHCALPPLKLNFGKKAGCRISNMHLDLFFITPRAQWLRAQVFLFMINKSGHVTDQKFPLGTLFLMINKIYVYFSFRGVFPIFGIIHCLIF